jgi:hypothetical protein
MLDGRSCSVIVTAGCAPSISRDVPPQVKFEVADTVQLAIPGVAVVFALKVKVMNSPGLIAAPSLFPVRFMV